MLIDKISTRKEEQKERRQAFHGQKLFTGSGDPLFFLTIELIINRHEKALQTKLSTLISAAWNNTFLRLAGERR
jgi:hypothetical protein